MKYTDSTKLRYFLRSSFHRENLIPLQPNTVYSVSPEITASCIQHFSDYWITAF